jgi:transposase
MKSKPKGLYLAKILSKYKGREYLTYLLRRSYREDGKVKQRTIANLTELPEVTRELVKESLQGRVFLPSEEAIEITRSRAHGNVAVIRKVMEDLGISELLSSRRSRESDLVEAMIAARIINPQTKLSTIRWWDNTTIPEEFSVEDADEDELYVALDWLLQRQETIERKLAQRHLSEGGLVLYDVSSSYYEGSHCELASYGYNRDRKKGKKQIVYGLMTDSKGVPISIQVYPGCTSDTKTIGEQVDKIKEEFKVGRFVVVGDRGMLTQGQIEGLKALGGVDWISAFRGPTIKSLFENGKLQLSLFDERDLLEIDSPDYPGERLIVCRNPFLAEERRRTREDLLRATEEKLNKLLRRVASGRLREEGKIGQALGRIENRYKMAKHFIFTIEDGKFDYRRNEDSITLEASLDGFYIIRTSVEKEKLTAEVVHSYKSLSRVERAFRTLKGVDLKIRPIHQWLEKRVRAHIFLCMLAYYVEWHLRESWKNMIFTDEYAGREHVLQSTRSESAFEKKRKKKLNDGTPVHSFQTLLSEMSTIVCSDAIVPAVPDAFIHYNNPHSSPFCTSLIVIFSGISERVFSLCLV